jgi:hypothetical protein
MTGLSNVRIQNEQLIQFCRIVADKLIVDAQLCKIGLLYDKKELYHILYRRQRPTKMDSHCH